MAAVKAKSTPKRAIRTRKRAWQGASTKKGKVHLPEFIGFRTIATDTASGPTVDLSLANCEELPSARVLLFAFHSMQSD
jgi:hypothetical protein